MSSSVAAIFVWETDRQALKGYLKAQKITKGYVSMASESIVAMTCKHINKTGEALALKISADLNTRTLFLLYDEDFGWECSGYLSGELMGAYQLDYAALPGETPVDEQLSFFADSAAGFTKLKDCVESNNEEHIFKESWRLLVELLGINMSDDYNYDTLQGMPEGYLLLSRTEPIAEKKSSLKKTLSEYLEPMLLERGFLPENGTTLPCDFAYFRKVGDFYVGLSIIKETNIKESKSIVPYLKTLFEDIPLFGSMRRFYKTNAELIKILDEIVREFDQSLVVYHNDLYFEAFDNNGELFMKYLHDFLTEHDYYIVDNSIERLAGGRILYNNMHSSSEVMFAHSLYYLGLSCFYTEDGFPKVVNITDETDHFVPPIIRSREGYVRLLTSYKKELSKIL